jgi:hypothetical protein
LSNFSLLFWNWSSLKKDQPWIFKVKITGVVFFILCGFALIAGFSLRAGISFFKLPKDFSYVRPSFRRVTNSTHGTICNVSVASVGIEKIAGILMTTHALDFSTWEGDPGFSAARASSEALRISRKLFEYILQDESTVSTPSPSPFPDLPRDSMCVSDRSVCLFLYGQENCSNISQFATVKDNWCNPVLGICQIFSVLNARPPEWCNLSISDGTIWREVCNPVVGSLWKYACTPSGLCENWDALCSTLPFGCNPIFRSRLCLPLGFCDTMPITERCSPFDLRFLVFRYLFQIEGQFVGVALDDAYVMATRGFLSPMDIGIAIENLGTVWFHYMVEVIIPFYRLVSSLLLKPVMGKLGQTMIQLIFGPNRMPLRFAQEVAAIGSVGMGSAVMLKTLFGYGSRPVMTGHSHSGLPMRAIAMKNGIYGISFEGSQYDLSPLHGFFGYPKEEVEYSIINEASGNSIFATDDEMAKCNYHLPDWQKWWKPSNPYETFCLLAAGCVDDDRYDHICNLSVGAERYREYFASWNRKRFD